MKIRLDSLGCRLNIGEAESLARALSARGHRIVGPGDETDLMILNTCAVTHVAARKSRKLIRYWRRTNPTAKLVATGCYTELEPAETAALGVDMIVPNAAKDDIPQILESAGLLGPAEAIPGPGDGPFPATDGAGARTRAFVKVQDGCDNRCTFCIVTVARGDSRSLPVSEIIAEIRALVRSGYQEVVLSGVHLGSYGHECGEDRLVDLVRAILESTDIPRLRLSSLEPWDLDAEFFSLWSEDARLLPHLHLPLQSGCDETLRRMARHTDQASFRRLVYEARDRIADLSVTTDVIVGFPGETDGEFESSIEFIEEMEFAKLHVFRYSPRARTAAAGMPNQVPPVVAQERSRRMHALGEQLEERFRRRFVGRTLQVLWESAEPRPEGVQWSGLSDNYVRVVTDASGDADLANRATATQIIGRGPGVLQGVAGG